MKKSIFFIVYLFLATNISGQNHNPYPPEGGEEVSQVIETFIQRIRSNDVSSLKQAVNYPFVLGYPLPSINTESEFEKQYYVLFDKKFREDIIQSDIQKDWFTVGWRGIGFQSGSLWLDYDGNLKGLNHSSKKLQKYRRKLIRADKRQLPRSLRHFEAPIALLETKSQRVRIDQISTYEYRYTSWSIGQGMSEEPNVVIKRGELIAEGSGGNHHYKFQINDLIYIVDYNVMGKRDFPPIVIIQKKGDKEILREPAKKIVPTAFRR